MALSLSLKSLSLESLNSLPERERRTLIIGGVAAVALLIFGILIPLDRSVTHAQQRLARKQADLTWMQSVSSEVSQTAPPPSANGESLLVIIDRSAREAGLAGALSGSEPHGPKALSLRLDKANFDKLIGWLARLQQQNGVIVDSATIDKAGEPGVVNASIVLHSG
jgi:general secretion pathway protein M